MYKSLKNAGGKLNLDFMEKETEKTIAAYLEKQILIAMPGMVDRNFAGSLTLLCQHNDEGAIGITINRLSDFSLGEIFAQLNIDCSNDDIRKLPVLEGGPVAPDRGFVLHTPQEGFESSLPVSSEIMVTTSRDVLAAIAGGSGPNKYIVALGYAGWGGGQLEGELRQNAWLSVEADSDIVFDMPLPKRFENALGKLGIQIDRLHSEGGHA
jgi:putative transcriptional regulator